jgi:hypothetical protein
VSGVSLSEAARFIGYELAYTLLPGCLLYMALSPSPGSWLLVLTIGWPCGYALEVGTFMLTAAFDARAAFTFLPPVVATVGGAYLLLGVARQSRPGLPHRHQVVRGRSAGPNRLVGAIAISLAVASFAVTHFPPSPLPPYARSVSYHPDNVFDISLAAEALHHWPMTRPWVAGEPLHYYPGVFIHAAAIDQVTGVPPSTAFLRLLPSLMLAIIFIQLWSMGELMGRSQWTGPVAVVLALATSGFGLDPYHLDLFQVTPVDLFSASPTFALGAIFLLGLLALTQTRFLGADMVGRTLTEHRPRSAPLGTKRAFMMMALLVLGCGAAKAFAVAVFVGGLGLLWVSYAAMSRIVDKKLGCAVLLSISGAAVVYWALLAGGGASTMHLAPLAFVASGDTFPQVRATLESLGGSDTSLLRMPAEAAAFLIASMPLSLLGVVWMVRRRLLLSPAVVLLLATFVAGVVACILFDAPGAPELYFLYYAYIAVVPVAAAGVVGVWGETSAGAKRMIVKWCLALLATGSMIGVLVVASAGELLPDRHLVAYAVVGAAIIAVAVRLYRVIAPAVLSRLRLLEMCGIPLLLTCSVLAPTILLASGAWKTVVRDEREIRPATASDGMTADLYRGLLWVRDHTNPCDVLATNATWLYFYYSAFAERRVFLESWGDTTSGLTTITQPFPKRFKLNTEAVMLGRPAALRQLGADGVGYVLVDRSHGNGSREPASTSRLVFANRALMVYRLVRDHAPQRARPGCAVVSGPE